MENCDFMSINDQLVTLLLDLTLVATVGGVILEHVDLIRKCKGDSFHKDILIKFRSLKLHALKTICIQYYPLITKTPSSLYTM